MISFHGLTRNKFNDLVPLPVFRSFYNKEYNTLSLSDKLLEDYSDKKLFLSWFVSPSNTNYFERYIEIIQFFINKYEKIIFYGSSGGGFPSLLFASHFNKTALIFNSQLYLEKYWYFKEFINIVQPSIDNNNYNIEYISYILNSLYSYQKSIDKKDYDILFELLNNKFIKKYIDITKLKFDIINYQSLDEEIINNHIDLE